jgi:hypothetical protein
MFPLFNHTNRFFAFVLEIKSLKKSETNTAYFHLILEQENPVIFVKFRARVHSFVLFFILKNIKI